MWIVVPPDDVSAAFSFELHLLLDESRAGIIPLTGRWYLTPRQSLETAGDRNLDPEVQQLTLGLPLSEDKEALNRAQLNGIDAMAGCGFRFTQITAMDLPGADGRTLSRSITLAASESTEEKVPPALLSFSSNQAADHDVSISVILSDGQESIIESALPFPSRSEMADQSQSMLNAIANQLLDKDACHRNMEEFSNTLELMAGLEKSLRRRRTVDVYFDGVSERGAFKTQMTAIGCGVLTYVTFGMIVFLVIAQVTNLPPLALEIGRILWIAPVVFFLLAQFLLPLARERRHRDEQSTISQKHEKGGDSRGPQSG